MILIPITVLCIILRCSPVAMGVCPTEGNRTPVPVVVPYQINDFDRTTTDLIVREIIPSHLNNYHLVASCNEIAELWPASYESGYYWIQGVSGAVGVYCEMDTNSTFGQPGGWMRIADVDMRNNQSQCPPGLVYNVTEGRRLCRRPSLDLGCFSTTFSTQGVEYRQVCGKVIGYQYYRPNAFGPSKFTSPLINQTYIDGISITHGSPRQHVWSFAAATDETVPTVANTGCPCLYPTFTGVIPSYLNNDYYCETGSRTKVQRRYYFDDPLWDGEGCEGENKCCDRGGPWFCKELPQPTQDDIEMRVCTNSQISDEDIVLEQIELYVQ